MILVMNPKNKRVYAAIDGDDVLYTFNGSAICGVDFSSWPRVHDRPVPCVSKWQQDPGEYGPFWITIRITSDSETAFTAGGSILYIKNWIRDHEPLAWRPLALYADRQSARDNAQVEW